MHSPVIRMVDAGLQDSMHGVIQQLQTLTLDSKSDSRPKNPAFLKMTDDDAAVSPDSLKATATHTWPLLITTVGQKAQIKITGVVGQAWDIPALEILVLYITGKTMTPAVASLDADYTLRCAVLALNAALFAHNTAAARVRGKVMIVKHNFITIEPADIELQQGRIAGILTLNLWVRVQP